VSELRGKGVSPSVQVVATYEEFVMPQWASDLTLDGNRVNGAHVNGFHRNKTHVSDSDDDDLIQEDDRNVLILHSSGTTGLPKPIYLAHRYLLGYAACHRFAEDEVVNSPNVSTLPLYHVRSSVT